MTTFTLFAPTTRAALLADLEELWQRFDELVGTLGPDDWSGKHWTFPDAPYHLAYFMASFARNMNREQTAQTHLTAVMEFSGLDGGVWTLHVAGGSCHIIKGRAARADLVIVQSPETFVKTRTGIQNPTLALWTGKIQVQGWRNLGTFEKVFPITRGCTRRLGEPTGEDEPSRENVIQ